MSLVNISKPELLELSRWSTTKIAAVRVEVDKNIMRDFLWTIKKRVLRRMESGPPPSGAA